ncbi:MAG: hypothetical protein ACXVZ2_03180 [Gaiellaceae bacterium]
MRRKLLVLLAAAGAVLASVAFFRRSGARRERVDLYFADGSMVSLGEGPDAERQLALGRTTLDAAR